MPAPRHWHPPARCQRGWLGLIGLLIALVIVAWLGRTLLAELLPSSTTANEHRAGNRVPGGASPADVDVTAADPSPRDAMSRAKGLESAVRDQAGDLSKRIDEQAK